MTTTKSTANLSSLDRTLETYFLEKAPKLPVDIQKIIVDFGPWVMLIGLIISIPSMLTAFGLSTGMSPFGMWGVSMYRSMSIYWAISLVTMVLQAMAIPGLFKKEMRSWKLLYYATLVGVVGSLIRFDIIGLIIGAGIGFYILYQIRHHYK